MPPAVTVTVPGVTVRPASVWVTVTATSAAAVSPPASVAVTRRVYAPARVNVAVVAAAALVPVAENVADPPLGADTTVHP